MPPRPEMLTHSSPFTEGYDARISSWVKSWCGETIRASADAGNFPSCPRCKARIAEREAIEV